MDNLKKLSLRLDKSLEIQGIHIPCAGIKIFTKEESIPQEIIKYEPDGIAITSCHALKAAMLGDAVLLTLKSIGCPAAGVSLGLVNKFDSRPLNGKREYTEIMKESSDKGDEFIPPSPMEFSDGTVYAFNDANKKDYALFGEKDSGRFKNQEIAKSSLEKMVMLKDNKAVFYFSPDFNETEIVPDIVVLSIRPAEMCRIIQGYQYLAGERIEASFSGLRAGCSDLISRPYMDKKINISPYCLGARLIAKFEAERMGMAFPFSIFETIVRGCEESKTGFPFPEYPGSSDI